MTLYDTDLFQEVGLNDGPNGGQEVPASGRVRARIQVGDHDCNEYNLCLVTNNLLTGYFR